MVYIDNRACKRRCTCDITRVALEVIFYMRDFTHFNVHVSLLSLENQSGIQEIDLSPYYTVRFLCVAWGEILFNFEEKKKV